MALERQSTYPVSRVAIADEFFARTLFEALTEGPTRLGCSVAGADEFGTQVYIEPHALPAIGTAISDCAPDVVPVAAAGAGMTFGARIGAIA